MEAYAFFVGSLNEWDVSQNERLFGNLLGNRGYESEAESFLDHNFENLPSMKLFHLIIPQGKIATVLELFCLLPTHKTTLKTSTSHLQNVFHKSLKFLRKNAFGAIQRKKRNRLTNF